MLIKVQAFIRINRSRECEPARISNILALKKFLYILFLKNSKIAIRFVLTTNSKLTSQFFFIKFTLLLTPVRTNSISGLKSRVMKIPFLSLKMMVKSGLEFILKLTEPLQSCCCPVQKYLPRMAELAWQLSRYL